MAIPYSTNYNLTIPFSDACAQVSLTTGVEQTYTVPGTSAQLYSARFTYAANSNVFVRLNGTAATPGANTVGLVSETEFRPGCDGSQRYVKGGDVLHFITPDATAYVGVRLMSLPS